MCFLRLLIIAVALLSARLAAAEKLTLAHVAINPGQGMFWIASDSGILARYGFTADIVLVPGSPRTIQALIAGDLDYAVAGSPGALRARMQGADVVLLASLSPYSSQRVLVRPDSKVQSLGDLRGKTIGVTQFGSAGDSFLRRALKSAGVRESDVTILQMGGTPGVTQALEAGRIEVGILGDSSMLLIFRGMARPLKGGSSRELGFKGLDAPLTTTERKIKSDRAAVSRFMNAYVEAIHFFKTNKPDTVRILSKYMRGLSDEEVGQWYDEYRDALPRLPYPDEDALRAELEQIGAVDARPASFVNTSFLDEMKKSGLVEKLYK